ncbi:MAG: FimV/HubP family polar landmark protein [Acidiferrobacteraceae bacterium]
MSKTASTASLFARLGLGIALLAPMAARALELGHLDLHSALGQRLKADIPLAFNNPPDLKRVRVGLASQDEFAGAGLAWTSMLGHISFHTVSRHGVYFIELRSSQPITQPYLQFLLRIDWPGGQLLREYTALLDPPYLMKQEEIATASTPPRQVTMPAAPPVAPPVVAPTAVAALSPSAPAPMAPLSLLGPPNVKPLPVATATAVATKPVGKQGVGKRMPHTIGPLKSGASLWGVASQLKAREQVGVPQIALALFRANGNAFLKHNMNGLKRGAVLTVPSQAAVLSISHRQAVKALRVQTAAWDAYRAQMARHPLVVATGSHTSGVASGQVAPAGAGAHAPHELLKIVGAGAAGSLQGKTAREVLKQGTSSLQGALASSQLENTHLATQVQKLKQQLEATKRLLTLENRELAQLQVQFKGGKVALVPPAVLAHKAMAGTLPKPVALPPKPVAAVQPHVVRKPPVMVPPPVSAPQTSFVDEVMASPLFVPLAGVLALLLAGLALYYRRRRQSIAEFEESILSGPVSDGASGSEESGKQTDVSFLSDFSQGGMGNIHTDEVDPIAEAEVYLAYGRDEQAEEILKEAIQKDSMRHELRLRLLEIYNQRKDVAAFETTAEELYAALEGKGGRIWARAEELGRKLSPDNPLFRRQTEQETAGTGDTLDAETVPASPLDLDTEVMDTGMPAGAHAKAPEVGGGAEHDDSFSFSLDMPAFSSATAVEPAAAETPVLGPEIADMNMLSVPASGLNGVSPATAQDEGTPEGEVEFDLDFMSTSSSSSEGLPADVLKDLGVSPPASGDNLEWAVNTGDAEGVEGRDDEGAAGTFAGASGADASGEAGTKLDLAKAYIDMGDSEGARGILNEVLTEGDDHQKEEARRLTATLS